MRRRRRKPGPFPEAFHGERARYVAGCRCDKCKEANRLYYHKNVRDRIYGRNNPIVKATKARNHLKKLQKAGVGLRTVSDISGVPRSTLFGIRKGERRNCRRKTMERILAVSKDAYGDAHLVDAGPTQKLLEVILSWGYTKTAVAAMLGSKAKTPALQLKTDRITARNELKVQRLHRKLQEERHEAQSRGVLPQKSMQQGCPHPHARQAK
jgi:hypothetical protein